MQASLRNLLNLDYLATRIKLRIIEVPKIIPEVIRAKFLKEFLEKASQASNQICYCTAPGPFSLHDLYFLHHGELKYYTLQTISETEYAFFGKKKIQGTLPEVLKQLFPEKELKPIDVPTEAQLEEFIQRVVVPMVK